MRDERISCGARASWTSTRADFAAVRSMDLGERVRSLTCPVLWLDGADDRIVRATDGRPGEVRRLEGVGHWVPIEARGYVAAGIAELVAMSASEQ